MSNNSIKYDKLIRDRIPETIEESGKKAIVEVLDEAQFEKYLNAKLTEEIDEYFRDKSIEELVDVVEVINAIVRNKGVTLEEFEQLRQAKADQRGAFKKKLLLKEVVEVRSKPENS